MPEAKTLRASHSHLYPGARLVAPAPMRWRRGTRLLVEFADLGAATARVEGVEGDRAQLAVDAHRTARGTVVVARRWIVERVEARGDHEEAGAWRVVARAADAA